MHLFFAGAEIEQHRDALIHSGAKKILISYYYLRRNKIDIEKLFDNFDMIAIDSGGFTLIDKFNKRNEAFKHRDFKRDVELYEEYLDDYISFIKKYAGRFFFVANYDVDYVVGSKTVIEWNKRFKEVEDMGQRVCYIAHDYTVPYNNLEYYFDNYDFIGVASDEKFRKDNAAYFSLVYNLSQQKRKLVHGFAMTNYVSFQNFPFFSSDSTTYLGGEKFGTTYVYNGAYFETWDSHHKYRREGLKLQCEEWGVDYAKFCADDNVEVKKFNIKSWLANEKLFNEKTRYLQWWL